METVFVRPGVVSDVPRALELIRELAEYERAPDAVTTNAEAMVRDGFGRQPVYRMWVADRHNLVVGIAICYVRYSTWKGRMLYLEDIVVTAAERGRGIGRLLFDTCRRVAEVEGFNGMMWQVLDWNESAIRFYQRYPVEMDSEWINCKIDVDKSRPKVNE
jgi:GNAT superfamily N-acetyltransferase